MAPPLTLPARDPKHDHYPSGTNIHAGIAGFAVRGIDPDTLCTSLSSTTKQAGTPIFDMDHVGDVFAIWPMVTAGEVVCLRLGPLRRASAAIRERKRRGEGGVHLLILSAASAQMQRFYHLPGGAVSVIPGSRFPDRQSVWKTAVTNSLAVLSGRGLAACEGH
ncbi:hypothetical protein M3484_00525 [Pseudomonas sp. GX19020]|uniref:hypothetical protein n=1 Tax=Pseudomonas sp. GX19020 TaxID=2942277 RepID=UPI0020192521|nr:hypothetical protein [Pseudomonas sp. GX19020]MCL4065063.1 hypothetical protein [Pseudomonas sp. GX19020]